MTKNRFRPLAVLAISVTMACVASATYGMASSAAAPNKATVVAKDFTTSASIIPNASAPHDFAFQTKLPAGTAIRSDGAAGLEFVKTGPSTTAGLRLVKWLGHLGAPWAVDAHGNSVPTSYSVAGTVITQHVKTTASTVFPVVARPNAYWPFSVSDVVFTSSATAQVRSPAALLSLRSSVCALVGASPASYTCAAVAYNKVGISAVATFASANNRCLALRHGVAPRAVSCTTAK